MCRIGGSETQYQSEKVALQSKLETSFPARPVFRVGNEIQDRLHRAKLPAIAIFGPCVERVNTSSLTSPMLAIAFPGRGPFSLRAQQRGETADLKTAKGVIVRSAQLKSRRERATNASDARSREAETLGCYGEYVERPDEIRSALSRSALT